MSAKKSLVVPYSVITNGDMSADLVSAATVIKHVDNVCYQIAWTGTANGQFFVDGSLDGKTWTQLDYPIKPAAGADASALLDMNQLSFFLIRLRYKFSSGTGTLNVLAGGKSL